jgi:3-methylcrotonyl-CoA carboxylase alpha subunit
MTLSSLLRITPRLVPTAARRTTRAASSASGTQGNKTLDSILIANRGEIALYVLPWLIFFLGLRLGLCEC